jgi:putative transposase
MDARQIVAAAPLDATYVKVRRNHRIVSVAVIVAVGVKEDGRREVLGMDRVFAQAEAARSARRSSSSSPTPMRASKAAVAKLNERDLATLPGPHHAQRARPCGQAQPARRFGGHGLRSAAPTPPRPMAQDRQLAQVQAFQLSAFTDEAETNVLAYMGFPADHWSKIHSTNGGDIKRRTEVAASFP